MSESRKEEGACRGDKVVGELARPRGSLRGPLILAKFVVDALAKKQQGDSSDYHATVEQLSASQMKPVAMQRWLQALMLCVSHLTEELDLLVGATLRFTWYDKDPDVVELYIDYLTHLISAHTYYLKSALQMLIKTLWIPTTEGEGVYHNVHKAVQAILHLVPTAPSVLMPLLNKNYPFKGKSADIQELAVRNVLHITTYCPTLRDDILQLVVHQMLSIDVEVPRLEEEEEEEEEERDDKEGGRAEGEEHEEMQFHVELESCSPNGACSNDGCHDDDHPSLTACYSKQQLMANEAAEKLDVMMTVVLYHLHSICHQRGVFVLDSAARLLRSLLKIFDQVILPTHACSHVQFLLFNLTSLNKAFPVCFLDFLWEKFQCPSTPLAIRQALAAYLASYIARAKFVTLDTAKLCLSMMVQWLHQYIDECSPEHMRPDVQKHGHFYSLCQAIFYVFIFRHKGLLEMEGGISFLRQMNLERLISCRLNPLKVCLPTVVEMFAALTSCHEIVFCYTILEQNKRLILSTPISPHLPSRQGPTAAPHPSHTNFLDSFFPFDPYCLKRSAKFVHPHYQEWEGEEKIRGEEMEEDDRSSVSSSFQSGHYPHSIDSPFSPSLPQNCSFSPH